MNFWRQKTFCLVTGASRGIGREIAVQFAKNVGDNSAFVLLARSEKDLDETKAKVQAVGKNCQVVISPTDLSKPSKDGFYNIITSALQSLGENASSYDHVLLVHNVGSLGNAKKRLIEMDDIEEIEDYYRLNVTSMMLLTSQFFRTFSDASKQRSVVHITSLSGVKPFKTWGYYCSGKAARDMQMKVLAVEEGIQVLSWAPGPVDTEMYEQGSTETGDPDLLKLMKDTKEQGKVLKPEETVSKLVRVLGTKEYTQGEHVDFFDIN